MESTHAMMHCPLCGQAAHTRTSHYYYHYH